LPWGAGFAVWCAIVVLQAEYHKHLPVPSPTSRSVSTLPGEFPHENRIAARRQTVNEEDYFFFVSSCFRGCI
jgi:hypothetical protein